MGKRDASHFITEYYTECGKVELMIPTDATDDDFALLKDILALVEAKMKQRADRKTEPSGYNLLPVEGEQTEELPPYLIRDWEGYLDEFEVEDEPQTDCETCKWWSDYGYCVLRNCKGYEPKDEPQADCAWK